MAANVELEMGQHEQATDPGPTLFADLDGMQEAWASLGRSLQRLSAAVGKASPRVRRYHAGNMTALEERLATVVADANRCTWIAKQLTHLMEDWLHTCLVP